MIARRFFILLFAAALAVLAAPRSIAAQQPAADPATEATVKRLASELRCPVCQGVSIEDSPTELANEMKSVIRGQLQEGKTPEQVKAYFVERYGEWILLQPKASGFNLIVYVLPLIMLLVGAGFVYRTVKRWSAVDPSELPLATAGGAGGGTEE